MESSIICSEIARFHSTVLYGAYVLQSQSHLDQRFGLVLGIIRPETMMLQEIPRARVVLERHR